jgi:integrase/recombinase XerD
MDDFKIEQQVKGRKKEYIELCYYRLNRWRKFIETEFAIDEAEEVKAKHVKQYILHAQKLGVEKAITINNAIATLRVFYNYLLRKNLLMNLLIQ